MNKKPKFKFSNKVKEGYYIADYFKKTTTIINKYNPNNVVTLQWFQRENNVVLCGIEQCLQLIKFACPNYCNLKVFSLKDGDIIQPLEPVLKIEGLYQDFGWLEGMIDGILARNSSISTNVNKLVIAANGKKIIDMNDRSDHYLNQENDGYASYIGGIRDFVTLASERYTNNYEDILLPTGTMPHALIQNFNGDILEATKAFYESFPNNKVVSLVDYNNDCINDALRVAEHFKEKLWAVRIDTSPMLIDKTLQKNYHKYPKGAELNGVNKYLIKELRNSLDIKGYTKVKIIVSSGFNANKIFEFEKEKVPVDFYGVGAEISKVWISFTGDCVALNGQPQAKIGREEIFSNRLQLMKISGCKKIESEFN